MKKYIFFIITIQFLNYSTYQLQAQGVGINSTGAAPHPSALLHVDAGTSTTKGLLVTGTWGFASAPNLGSGSRLTFYPGKGAFRAGFASGTEWDDLNTGYNSAAFGRATTASGERSFALGNETRATGVTSMAMGQNTNASGNVATAFGTSTTASGGSSTAMGTFSTASGSHSTAMGFNTTASGFVSKASGIYAIASGDASTAMGSYMNTNGKSGAFLIGDSDPNGEGAVLGGFPDQFVARFWNGYYFLTSGNTNRFGVQIGHNGNAWVSICDKNRKENFEPLNGEEILQKISKINFSSWNYKQQDPKIYRHYGITAQDFYNAFGKDKYGTIGNDTTVNPVDMIGIDMAAIQALEKRTADLKKETALLNKKMGEIAELKKENESLKQAIAQLQQQMKTLDSNSNIKETVAVK